MSQLNKRVLPTESLKLPAPLRKSLRRIAVKIRIARTNPFTGDRDDDHLLKSSSPDAFRYDPAKSRFPEVEFMFHHPNQYPREAATVSWELSHYKRRKLDFEKMVAIVEYYLGHFTEYFFWNWSQHGTGSRDAHTIQPRALHLIRRRLDRPAQRLAHQVMWGLKIVLEKKQDLMGPRPLKVRRRRRRRRKPQGDPDAVPQT